MHSTDGDHGRKGSKGRALARRSFLKGLAALSGGVLTWRAAEASSASGVAHAQENSAPPSPLAGLPESYQGYPAPSYIPAGFALSEVFTERPDGFLIGSAELAFWYVNWRHTLGVSNPLSIYVAPWQDNAQLVTSAPRSGEPTILSGGNAKAVQAEYHDGFWTYSGETDGLVWNTTNVHSLTFRTPGFIIGVRGARLTGVGLDEFTRVAASLI